MNTQNKLMKLIGGTTLIALIAAASQPLPVDAASSKHIRIRISHAKELLGKSYKKSVVGKTEGYDDVPGFVTAATKRFLPKAFKRQSSRLSAAIMAESERYGFDPIFLMAVIQNESSFNPNRIGSAGEIGLMQIKPTTAEWIAKHYKIKFDGAHSLYDPAVNVRIGAAYMHKLKTQFDSKSGLYVSAYNIGASKVRRMAISKRNPKDYVMAVMKRYLAIYSALNTAGDSHQRGQMAWVKVSNVTARPLEQIVTN